MSLDENARGPSCRFRADRRARRWPRPRDPQGWRIRRCGRSSGTRPQKSGKAVRFSGIEAVDGASEHERERVLPCPRSGRQGSWTAERDLSGWTRAGESRRGVAQEFAEAHGLSLAELAELAG